MFKDVMQGTGILIASTAMVIIPLSLSPSPSLSTPNDDDVAMIHDPSNDTYTVYPDSLPPCDDEDGTSISNSLPVSACAWDASTQGNGSGRSFIVLSPSLPR